MTDPINDPGVESSGGFSLKASYQLISAAGRKDRSEIRDSARNNTVVFAGTFTAGGLRVEAGAGGSLWVAPAAGSTGGSAPAWTRYAPASSRA